MKSRKALVAFWIFVCIALTAPQFSSAQEKSENGGPTGKIITFDAPGAGNCTAGSANTPNCSNYTNCFGACPGTVAEDSNSRGEITGYFVDNNNVYHGFVRHPDGKIDTFDAPGAGSTAGTAQGTIAYSINSEGVIAGQFQGGDNVYHGFVRFPDGKITAFDITGFKAAAFQGPGGTANINDDGEIAGYYVDGNFVNRGFVRRRDGTIQIFDVMTASMLADSPPQGTVVALETGLSNDGNLTGWYYDSGQAVHGYLREADGTITSFDNVAAGSMAYQGTYGGSINCKGEIAGGVLDSSYVYHGFVRHPNGDMDTFEVNGSGDAQGSFQGTFAVGINSQADVTAYFTDSSNVTHGAIRDRWGQITKFDVKGAGTGTGQGTTPQNINERGDVPGYFTTLDNVNHGFIYIQSDRDR